MPYAIKKFFEECETLFFRKVSHGLFMFGLAGALFWGMRGSPGYGGISGAVVPGLMWGLAWYHLARPGSDKARLAWIVLACTLGFGLGGYNGYGQFISWIQGRFHVNYPESYVPIGKWTGYLSLFACGAGWGGLGGVFLSWVFQKDRKVFSWVVRVLMVPAGFAAGNIIAHRYPGLFMPFYTPEAYDPSRCPDCVRTYNTAIDLVSYASMTVAALLYEAARRDVRAMKIISVAAVGFGIAFAGCAPFHYLNVSWPVFDWWKEWEMSLGFVAGAAIWIIFRMTRGFDSEDEREISLPRSTPAAVFLKVNLVTFLIVNWAFFNCAGVHWGGSVVTHAVIFACFFILSAFVFLVPAIRSLRGAGVKAETGGGDIFTKPALALSAMALIVIFPSYRIMVVFIMLAVGIILARAGTGAGPGTTN